MSEFTNNDGGNKNFFSRFRDFLKGPEKPKITINHKIQIYGQSNSGEASNHIQTEEAEAVNPESRITINDVSYNKVEFDGRTVNWYRQKNSWDCGPCMCLNMQSLLNTKNNSNAVSDVDNFRIWAENNTLMMKDRRILQNGQILTSREKLRYTRDMDTEWLRVEDVRNYIKDSLGLKEIAIEEASTLRTITENNSRKKDIFIWGVSNSHYRGYFLGKNGSVYNVDSFRQSPEMARIDDVSNFVRGATGTCFIAVGPEPKITILNQNR